MSSVNTGRIKQIRPRIGNTFGNAIPLGVDGLLTDMISGLDLEQELVIGGNHYVEISEIDTGTVIKEWYFSQAMKGRTLQQMQNKITYSVYIYIATAIDYYLIDQKGQNETEDSIISWAGNDEDGIVDRVPITSNKERIQITLYKGIMNSRNKLHQKVISITELSNEEYTISEQVDWDEENSESEGGEG